MRQPWRPLRSTFLYYLWPALPWDVSGHSSHTFKKSRLAVSWLQSVPELQVSKTFRTWKRMVWDLCAVIFKCIFHYMFGVFFQKLWIICPSYLLQCCIKWLSKPLYWKLCSRRAEPKVLCVLPPELPLSCQVPESSKTFWFFPPVTQEDFSQVHQINNFNVVPSQSESLCFSSADSSVVPVPAHWTGLLH